MSRVVLDLPPGWALALVAFVPLSTVVLVHLINAALNLVPHRLNPLAAPTGGAEDDEPRSPTKRGWKDWLRALLALAHAVVWGAFSVNTGVTQHAAGWKTAVQLGLVSAGWLYAALAPILAPSQTAPILLFSFYLEHLVGMALHFVSIILHGTSTSRWIVSFALVGCNLALIAVTLTFPLEPSPTPIELRQREKQAQESAAQAEPAEGAEIGKEPLMPSPERVVTLGGWLAFTWVGPLMRLALKRKIHYPDLWVLPGLMQAGVIHRGTASRSRASLRWRLFWCSSQDWIVCLFFSELSTVFKYAPAFCLNRILASLAEPAPGQAPDPNARTSAFIYAGLMFLAAFLRAQSDLQHNWANLRAGLRVRSYVMQEVYLKALKRRDLSGATAARKDADGTKTNEEEVVGASNGKVLQLMNNDSWKISNAADPISMLLQAPLELAFSVYGLYTLLGWTCFVGLSFAWIISPLQTHVMRKRRAAQKAMMSKRDARTEAVNELVGAIRFVKYSAGETTWLGKVFAKREDELKTIRETRVLDIFMVSLWNFAPDGTEILALAAAAIIGRREFNISILFTSIALFNLLQEPIGQIPWAWTQLQEVQLSTDRLEAFFAEDEVDDWVSALKSNGEASVGESKVAIVNGSFSYRKSEDAQLVEVVDQFSLKEINVEFPLGQLSLVCGPTGSGKTSLLLALLGEMHTIAGKTFLPKAAHTVDSAGLYDGVAYCSQLPWLQHATIQDNITFGSKFDKARYDAVIDACALQPDLKQFEAGDQTEIGEKGISLSGGQKARVALARAVYSRAKTVLLDDPLSAVDSHTAKHLYKKCLKGPLLEGRTVILVTHHVALCLRGAAFVVQIKNGTIESQGDASSLDESIIVEEKAYIDDEDEEEVVEPELVEVLAEADSVKKAIATEAPSTTAITAETPARAPGKLITDEANKSGSVGLKVYLAFFRAVGWDVWFGLALSMGVRRLVEVSGRLFVSAWGASYRTQQGEAPVSGLNFQLYSTSEVARATTEDGYLFGFPSASDNVLPWLGVYTFVKLFAISFIAINGLISLRGFNRASSSLFSTALTCVCRAPFRYWDTTPTGRVMNRFASDFMAIDHDLPHQVPHGVQLALGFLVDLGVILVVSPVFILPAAVIIYLYARLALLYVQSSRDIRRLMSNARSPIFSKFGELLNGVSTVRAFGAEHVFFEWLQKDVNKYLSAVYAGAVVRRYLNWRFDLLGAAAVSITTILALNSGAGAGKAAIAITTAQALIEGVHSICSVASQLETDLNAVERVTELLETPQEPPAIIEGKRPAANWPSDTGSLVVENLVMSYAPDLPAVVRGVSFTVNPREKVGLVGRTGSGKSTMALSLLRFTEPTSGKIIIDGVDITQIGLDDLRSRLTLIPQEAVLFSGTVRSNLDPFNQLTDAACLDALARVHLTDSYSSTQGDAAPADSGRLSVSLDDAVSAGGLNFSAGQRQLLAMARALLRRSKVIIMDEATASVDMETDSKIQQTIAEEFESSIVLCIAHRLKTVISMDKILVLDSGVVVEYDTPKKLLENKEGAFYKMCEASSEWDELKRVAGVV